MTWMRSMPDVALLDPLDAGALDSVLGLLEKVTSPALV